VPILRVLLIADTHLGFDLPLRPRVERRRRGPDFFANYERALEPARRGEIDLVVHGGDVLFRSKVRRELVYRAFEPLIAVAERGVPVVVVPGNHERSTIPFPLLAAHPDVHILDRPRTVRLKVGGADVVVVGFPCQRRGVGNDFGQLLEKTNWVGQGAAKVVRLLCLHQTVEGARVGPTGYTFRAGADVIAGRHIPTGFSAVLAGHIHRHQVLTRDLADRPLAAPVLYPGSIERTSTAERAEPKGYMTLELRPSHDGGRLESWSFHELPSRPMIDLEVQVTGLSAPRLASRLRALLGSVDPNAVVRLKIVGDVEPSAAPVLRAARLRSLAPPTITLTLPRPRSARPPNDRG
jgi:DNA repair exonuclease SbcCD nuclease subunit